MHDGWRTIEKLWLYARHDKFANKLNGSCAQFQKMSSTWVVGFALFENVTPMYVTDMGQHRECCVYYTLYTQIGMSRYKANTFHH